MTNQKSKISEEEIEKLASLSRIRLSEDEIEKYQGQLSSILSYVEQLNAVDVEGVEPTSQVTGLMNVMRKDEENSEARIENRELQEMAPSFERGYVKVPKVF